MKVLVIIDLQKRFNPSEKLVDDILKESKKYNLIVATKFINGNHLFQKVLSFKKLKNKDLELVELPTNTKVFEKIGYAVSDDLINYLKYKKVTEVDICGLETDACVLASAYKFWDSAIKPNILYNLTNTPSLKLKKAINIITKRNFGV